MITSAEEFVKLRKSEKLEEYCRAADESATEEVWLDVIQKYPDMRKWVAHNKTVKGRVLEILSDDLDKEVRRQVARRRAAGEEILSKLAFDPDEIVRLTVLRNPKVSKEIIMQLAIDKSDYIKEKAKEKLSKMS